MQSLNLIILFTAYENKLIFFIFLLYKNNLFSKILEHVVFKDINK